MNNQLDSTHPVARQVAIFSLALAFTATLVAYPKVSKAGNNSNSVPSEIEEFPLSNR